MVHEKTAGALAVKLKERQRGPTVLERRWAEEAEPEEEQSRRPPAAKKATVQKEAVVSGGKATKTGFILARAQLSAATGGAVQKITYSYVRDKAGASKWDTVA